MTAVSCDGSNGIRRAGGLFGFRVPRCVGKNPAFSIAGIDHAVRKGQCPRILTGESLCRLLCAVHREDSHGKGSGNCDIFAEADHIPDVGPFFPPLIQDAVVRIRKIIPICIVHRAERPGLKIPEENARIKGRIYQAAAVQHYFARVAAACIPYSLMPVAAEQLDPLVHSAKTQPALIRIHSQKRVFPGGGLLSDLVLFQIIFDAVS